MKTAKIALTLLALVAASSSAPAPNPSGVGDYSYDYDSYDDAGYGGYLEQRQNRLPVSMFDNLQPRPLQRGAQQTSPCSWAVVQCCGVPDRMGARNDCFSRLGCPGAWFTDICTASIQKSIFKGVLNSLGGF